MDNQSPIPPEGLYEETHTVPQDEKPKKKPKIHGGVLVGIALAFIALMLFGNCGNSSNKVIYEDNYIVVTGFTLQQYNDGSPAMQYTVKNKTGYTFDGIWVFADGYTSNGEYVAQCTGIVEYLNPNGKTTFTVPVWNTKTNSPASMDDAKRIKKVVSSSESYYTYIR